MNFKFRQRKCDVTFINIKIDICDLLSKDRSNDGCKLILLEIKLLAFHAHASKRKVMISSPCEIENYTSRHHKVN